MFVVCANIHMGGLLASTVRQLRLPGVGRRSRLAYVTDRGRMDPGVRRRRRLEGVRR